MKSIEILESTDLDPLRSRLDRVEANFVTDVDPIRARLDKLESDVEKVVRANVIHERVPLTETRKFVSGERFDGKNVTFTLQAGWNFFPLQIDATSDVKAKNFNVIAMPDGLTQNRGLLNITKECNNIELENITLTGSRKDGESESNGVQHGIMIFPGNSGEVSRDLKFRDVHVKDSPKLKSQPNGSWQWFMAQTENTTIENCSSNYSSGEGMKIRENKHLRLINFEAAYNGRDGISSNFIDNLDIVNPYLHHNETNGLGTKWANPNNNSPPGTILPFHGLHISGGYIGDNKNTGMFLQGWHDTAKASDSPHGFGNVVSGTRIMNNANSGIMNGDGISYTFRDCIFAYNGSNGIDLAKNSRWSTWLSCLFVNNKSANINNLGRDHRFERCRCYGIDIFRHPFDKWSSKYNQWMGSPAQGRLLMETKGGFRAPTKYGINYQYHNQYPEVPVESRDHTMHIGCVNEYSQTTSSNNKPASVPDAFWK